MKKATEPLLLAGAAGIATFGVAIVNVSAGGTIDARVVLTFLVFAIGFGGLHISVRAWAREAVPYLLPTAAFLTAVGFVEIYRLDRSFAARQGWWIVIAGALGSLLLFLLNRQGLAALRRFRYITLLAAFVLLALPLLPENWLLGGRTVNGSRLWVELDAGIITVQFQPGEIVKVLLVVFLASFLAERQAALTGADKWLGKVRLPQPRLLVPVGIAWIVSLGVLIYQRDLGASLLLLATFVAMMYAATGRGVYPTVGLGLFAAGALAAWRMFDHVQVRVDAWLDPFADAAGSGYQIVQGLYAMGSGALTGSGLGLGRPYLIPAARTDFIFAATAEELGLAGAVAVLMGFALLLAASLGIGLRSRDLFRKLLATGLAFVLGIQAILIIGGIVRVLPLTGIALPFMSYGGSSLVANFFILAFLARISHEDQT